MKSISPKECISLPTIPTVIVASCPDLVRFNRLADKIRERVGAQSIERFQLSALNQGSLTTILDSLSTLSLFAQSRVLVFQLGDKKQSLLHALATGIDNLTPGTHVIIRTAERTVPADLRGLRDGVHALFDLLEGSTLTQWLGRETSRLGITQINTGALNTLAQVGGGDLDAAYQALEQVALYADGEPITEQLVRQVISVVPEQEEFALLDAIDSGNIARAEHTTESLLNQGSNAFAMLGMIARNQLNKVAVAAGLKSRVADEPLKRLLGMTPWVFDRIKKSAAKTDALSMKRTINAIVTADARLKGKALGPQAILSELLRALMHSSIKPGSKKQSANAPRSQVQSSQTQSKQPTPGGTGSDPFRDSFRNPFDSSDSNSFLL